MDASGSSGTRDSETVTSSTSSDGRRSVSSETSVELSESAGCIVG